VGHCGVPASASLAAKKFFRRLLTELRYVPRVLVTDKLASYAPAHRVVMPTVEHRQSKYQNNRAENSHQPTRQRERAVKRFTSPRHAQRFLSAFSHISPHFRPWRHLLSTTGWRHDGRALHRLEPDHPGEHDRRPNVNWDRAFHQNRRTTQHPDDKPTNQPDRARGGGRVGLGWQCGMRSGL
jgi:putative transposase